MTDWQPGDPLYERLLQLRAQLSNDAASWPEPLAAVDDCTSALADVDPPEGRR